MKVKFWVELGMTRREEVLEVGDEDLEGLDKHGVEAYLDSLVQDWMHLHVYSGWEKVTEEV